MYNRKLKNVRKNADISLQDMAFLLDIDVSNLSKYERGVKAGTLKVFLGYSIITGISLHDLVQEKTEELIKSTNERTEARIKILEQEWQSPKVRLRIEKMFEVLNHINRFNKSKQDENYES